MDNLQQIHCRSTRSPSSYVSTAMFDDSHDIVWVGDQKGGVSAYTGPTLNAYTAFKATLNSPVNQLLNHPQGILTLGNDSLKLSDYHALPISFTHPKSKTLTNNDGLIFKNFKAMSYGNASQNSVIIGGDIDGKLLDFNLTKQELNGTIYHESAVAVMKASNKYLAVGNTNGSIDILDISSNKSIVKNFQAHQLSFSQIDLKNYLLVTTGYSKRHNYGNISSVDPLVNVYDLRYLKSSAPVSFPAGASFVAIHPKMQNMCFICSATGQLQFIDLFKVSNFKIYQISLISPNGQAHQTFLTGNSQSIPRIVKMEISNSGNYLILIDNFDTMYLWSTDPSSHMNNNSKVLDYPTALDQDQLNHIRFHVDDLDEPLNSVGLPYYKESLLSNFPSELRFKKGTLPKKIPNEILKNSVNKPITKNIYQRKKEPINLIPYNKSKYGPRNLHQYWFSLDAKDKSNNVPKFISEQDSDVEEEQLEKSFDKLSKIFEYKPSSLEIPPAFSKLHILYSKFGIEDFDFKFYNKSMKKFSGLEIDIENSYCNSLLILYRFIPEFYNWVTESLASDPLVYENSNKIKKSLLAELGYLYDMMSNSQGKNCRTTNFQNVLNAIPEATQLGLLENGKKYIFNNSESVEANEEHMGIEQDDKEDDDDDEDKLSNLIHAFNKFLLGRLSYDERQLLWVTFQEKKKHYNACVAEYLKNCNNLPNDFDDTKSISLNRICGINIETEIKSASCSFASRRHDTVYTLNVKCTNDHSTPVTNSPKLSKNYLYGANSKLKPRIDQHNSQYQYNQTILPYIDAAMNNNTFNPARVWCSDCERYQSMTTIKTVRNLPNVLSLNLNLTDDRELIKKTSAEQIKNGSKTHWLVNEFYAKLSNSSQRPILKLNQADFGGKPNNNFSKNKTNLLNKVPMFDDVNLNLTNLNFEENSNNKKSKNANEIIKYELVGYVCEICESEENNKHLVSFVKVKNGDGYQWYLFNDFLIIPISDENEVFNLSYWWKKPLIIIYQSNKSTSEFNYNFNKFDLDTEILYRDYFAKGTREGKIIEYELLTEEEAPQPGTLVALDAEFVILERDKYEIRSDGTKVLIKPKKQSLARVSVVRGNEGSKRGIAFIDDYIVIDEPVEDYITSFSGIEPGDLDPEISKKSLTYLEVAYRKLWLLLQIGVIFIGHGLTNDFRAINIQVPDYQVRDTSKLYHKKDIKRRLGLKFLMFSVLGKDVQVGNHDSIEDAKSALDLYVKYEELKENGSFEKELNRVYREGSKLGFKVPN